MRETYWKSGNTGFIWAFKLSLWNIWKSTLRIICVFGKVTGITFTWEPNQDDLATLSSDIEAFFELIEWVSITELSWIRHESLY